MLDKWNAFFDGEWIENPSDEEAEAIDRHNAGILAVGKGMMCLLGGIGIGIGTRMLMPHIGM